jgi:hypothetical protein
MIYKIPFRIAVNILFLILFSVLIFHVLIVFQIIPYNIVWAGKLKSVTEMYQFEMISLLINSIVILIVAQKSDYLKLKIPAKLVNGMLWFFVVLFSLNTIGNLFAEQNLETIVFTPITAISALLYLRLALEK